MGSKVSSLSLADTSSSLEPASRVVKTSRAIERSRATQIVGKKLLILLLLLCTSGCGASFHIRPTVVFIGDSITYNWSQSWAGQQTTFTQNNWLNVGVVGLTSSQIAAGFDAYV